MARGSDELTPVSAVGAQVLAAGLLGMGALFAAAPGLASRVFGLPAGREAWPYVRALAFRDLAVSTALLAASRGRAGPLRWLAASVALIPMADAAMVAAKRGRRGAPSVALHGVAGVALVALAASTFLKPRRR
ncbi:DUF4267 domain-containing protein [Phenylobacterium deserti]|nr:DUF4267 domain-containing protein [Phenylobacterium deserti]